MLVVVALLLAGCGWKVQRDCSRPGYATDRVLEELDQREVPAPAGDDAPAAAEASPS